jgi:hypothetical protein
LTLAQRTDAAPAATESATSIALGRWLRRLPDQPANVELRPLQRANEANWNRATGGIRIDEIAERIRALGSLAPGGLRNLADMAGIDELEEDAEAEAMVKHLADSNRRLVEHAAAARDHAAEAGDKESEDLMGPNPGARQDDLDAPELPRLSLFLAA